MFKYALRILIPVIFFVIVFRIIEPEDVGMAFRKAEWSWFCIGSLCILIIYFLCSLRTRELLLEKKQSPAKLWTIHALSSLISGFLPFRTGELSYVYYLRKYCTTPTAEGVGILVSVRFVEYLIFLISIFCLSALGAFMEPSGLNWTVFAVIGGNLLLVLTVAWNANIFYRALKWLSQTSLSLILGKSTIETINEKMEAFSHTTKRLFSSKGSTKPLILTIAIVILRQGFVLSMLKAMGITISLWLVILLFAFLYAAKFVQGIGSFGNQEAGIAAALVLTGYPQMEALPIAIGMHLLQWAPILFFGFIAYVAVRLL